MLSKHPGGRLALGTLLILGLLQPSYLSATQAAPPKAGVKVDSGEARAFDWTVVASAAPPSSSQSCLQVEVGPTRRARGIRARVSGCSNIRRRPLIVSAG